MPGWLVEATKSAGASYFGVFCGRQQGCKDIFRFYFGLTSAGRWCELVASPVVSFSWHLFSVERGGKRFAAGWFDGCFDDCSRLWPDLPFVLKVPIPGRDQDSVASEDAKNAHWARQKIKCIFKSRECGWLYGCCSFRLWQSVKLFYWRRGYQLLFTLWPLDGNKVASRPEADGGELATSSRPSVVNDVH